MAPSALVRPVRVVPLRLTGRRPQRFNQPACERHVRNPNRDHFPREVFFFGFGLPEVAVFAVPGLFFLPFAAIVSLLSGCFAVDGE
jgi:hypothetical protein